MGKVLLGMLLGVGGLIFVGVVLIGKQSRSTSNQQLNKMYQATTSDGTSDGNAFPSKPIRISAPQLYYAYHANEVAADNKYKGQQLIVEAQVATIRKNFTDQIVLELATYQPYETVSAYLDGEYSSKAAQLQRGEVVTVTCVGDGMIVSSPMLKNCSIRRTQFEQIAAQPQMQASQTQAAQPHSNVVYKSDNGIIPPTVIYSIEANYTDEARRAKLEGTSTISLIVSEDGIPQNVHVTSFLGKGLDIEAIKAVQQYRFKPAINAATGQPTAVPVNVEVKFSFY